MDSIIVSFTLTATHRPTAVRQHMHPQMERRQRQQQAAATTIITMDTRRRKAGGQQTPQLAVAVALSLIVCCSRLSGAFIHPALTHRPILPPQQHVPSRRAQPGAKNRGEGSHVAGKGFGNNAPEAEPAKAGSAERTVPVSGLFSWEKEYQVRGAWFRRGLTIPLDVFVFCSAYTSVKCVTLSS